MLDMLRQGHLVPGGPPCVTKTISLETSEFCNNLTNLGMMFRYQLPFRRGQERSNRYPAAIAHHSPILAYSLAHFDNNRLGTYVHGALAVGMAHLLQVVAGKHSARRKELAGASFALLWRVESLRMDCRPRQPRLAPIGLSSIRSQKAQPPEPLVTISWPGGIQPDAKP